MADEAQPAARRDDQVQHTQAKLGRRIGGVVGGVAAIAVLAGVIVLAGGLEVVTAGLATPVLIGAGMVAVGATMGAVSAFSDVGADIGRGYHADTGPISSGEPTVVVGKERRPLAHVGSNVSCERDKHPTALTFDVPNPAYEQITQGSDSVLVGVGAWQVARVGSKGTCGFEVAQGCNSVIVGGPTGTYGPIEGDDPEAGAFHAVGTAGGWLMLGGVLLMEGPFAAVMAFGIGKLIGVGLEQLPEGLARDSAAAAISLLPLAGLPRMMGGIRARTNEGLALRVGETPEEFQARVKQAYNARVEAEWNAKVAGSKPQGAWIPTDAFGRPYPAGEAARMPGMGGAGGGIAGMGGAVDPMRAPVMMSSSTGGGGGSGTGGSASGPHPDVALSKAGDPAATFRQNQVKSQAALDKGNMESAHGYDIENKIITEKGTDVVKAGEDVSYTNSAGDVKSTDIDVETSTEVIQIKSGGKMPDPDQMEATQLHAAAVGKPVRVMYNQNKVPGPAVRDFARRNPGVILEERTDF